MNTFDTTPDLSSRSLGFWLRVADRAITAEFARTFADEGLDRRDWMVLKVLAGEVDAPGLADRVRRGGKRVRALAARGWAEETDGSWTLTELGRTERERIRGRMRAVRSRIAGAVSAEDHATTLATLETVTRELDGDGSARRECGHRRFGHRFGHGFGPREHREHPGGHPHHRGERAFERGFTAGFRAGRDAA